MKYAVSVKEQTLDAEIDRRFGRAMQFAIYDTANRSCSWHQNTQNYNAAQGAGIQTAQNVIDLGADAVISGHCGPKAYRILSAAGIIVYAVESNVTLQDAVKMAENGELKALEGADVEGHWI
jgi:predicted Fe-Mo cluster-binding NifX family protein